MFDIIKEFPLTRRFSVLLYADMRCKADLANEIIFQLDLAQETRPLSTDK